jgi:hypothetical protein
LKLVLLLHTTASTFVARIVDLICNIHIGDAMLYWQYEVAKSGACHVHPMHFLNEITEQDVIAHQQRQMWQRVQA